MNKLSRKSEMYKNGFTLAEVLITLVIVGVVAALTIPNVINDYQKRETVSRLKKAYSSLCNAVKLAELNLGDSASNWDFDLDGKDFFDRYLRPYIATAQPNSLTEYQEKARVKYLNGQDCTGEQWCKTNPSGGLNYNAVLSDGTLMIIESYHTSTATYKLVIFDLNGLKSPNKVGRDIFVFIFYKGEMHVLPHGNSYTREEVLGDLNHSCNVKHTGQSCSRLIMIDSWQIKNDYPW